MRPTRVLAVLVLAVASVCVAGPALAADRHGEGRLRLKLDAVSCVGDTLSATVIGSGPAGTVLTVHPVGVGRGNRDHGAASVPAASLTLPLPDGGAPVHFDVAGMRANAYQVAVDADHRRVAQSRAIPAGSCAPGHEVPEMPVALLAPLTMLGTVALGTWRLRSARTAA